MEPSPATKAIVSYLPDTTYLNEQMKVKEALTYFKTFYQDFDLDVLKVFFVTLASMKIAASKNSQKGIKRRFS